MTALMPSSRFDWERLIRRIVMPKPVKLAAFVLATYADPDGTRVRPGMEVLAAVTGDSEKNARRILSTLREMGLVELVSRGGGKGGRGKASEYRLTIPDDLLERFAMLEPGDKPAESPDIQMSAQSTHNPVDNPVDKDDSPDTQTSGQSEADEPNDRTSRALSEPMTGHLGSNDRTSRCPTTSHVHQPPKETRPVVTTAGESRPRAREPPNDTNPIHVPAIPEAS